MTRLVTAVVFFGAVATTSCGPPMEKIDIKQNPNPKMRYELSLTVQDAPGPFESVEGFMQYEFADKGCSPKNHVSGTRNPPFKDVPIEFRRTGDNSYSGTLYLDLLVDEDYYGLGVCHWRMVGVTTQMKAHGVTFSSFIDSDKVTLQQPATGYFAKKTYAPSSARDMVFGAAPFSEWVSKQPNSFFFTTLTTREQFE